MLLFVESSFTHIQQVCLLVLLLHYDGDKNVTVVKYLEGDRVMLEPCHVCVAGVPQVSGMRVYTPGDVEAVNGTDVRLKCTFQSSASINPNTIVIFWSFRPLKPGREESVRKPPSDCPEGSGPPPSGVVGSSCSAREPSLKLNPIYLFRCSTTSSGRIPRLKAFSGSASSGLVT